ncbi:eukaryotic translation initiation factor 2-alpha kinase 3-like [Apostichopus japonicus]|uniref:eukaryotic translation initiation factor 2-alpha kinase 3-like n=1 Tax=Stichopus japonicus TaxID=307972 RepID=UPI003AB124E2
MGHLLDAVVRISFYIVLLTFTVPQGTTAVNLKARGESNENNLGNRGVPGNVNTNDRPKSPSRSAGLGVGKQIRPEKPKDMPSSVASYRCASIQRKRPLVVVSSMNGAVTALDLHGSGSKLWDLDAGTGPLLSSSLSSQNFLDGEKKILPALDGDIFTWDGTRLESCPFSTDSLISSSFKLSDNVMVVGSKSTRTYGINANTGKLVYSCSPEECTNIGPQPSASDDVIVTKFQQHVVRALDQRTGDEKWNYSVGQHDVKYLVGYETNADEFCRGRDEMLWDESTELRISMEYNMVFGVKETNHREILWSHEFSSDIANVWTIIDGTVKELDILSLDIDPSLSQEQNLIPYADPIMPSFIGRFQDQLYVRPSRTQSQYADESTTSSPVELIADESGYGLVPRIRWRPYLSSADSRTPILAHSGKQQSDNDNLGFIGPIEKPGDAARWSQYPFDAGYSLPFLLNKCPKTDLFESHRSKRRKPLVDNESMQSNEKGINIFLGLSVWNWWREMIISSVIMAVGWQLLYQFVLKAACEVPVDSAQSEVVFAEEAMRVEVVPETNKGFTSRYLSDFNHQECLGKGGFGIVFQAQNRVDESSYAIKRISLPHREEAREKVLREARALARLEHFGIVRYFQSWIEEPPPGWQEEYDQVFMGADSSLNEPISTFTTSATFNKDSQLLRDKRRFLRQTSNDSSAHLFGGGDDGDSPALGDHGEDEESGSFCVDFKSGPTAAKCTLETLKPFDIDCLSISESNDSVNVPFQRYSKVDETSDSLDIVFEDSGCSAKSQTNSSKPDIEPHVSSEPFQVTDITHRSRRRNKSSDADQSAISELQPETDPVVRSKIYLYIQMQLCQKETLKDWLNQNTKLRDRNKLLHIFQQILGAVNYVHQCGMIHRDLKPSNIFFSMDGSVKVGDFGLVTAMDTELKAELQTEQYRGNTRHTSQVGTQLYMSPEQVKGHSYDHKVDIFSLGLILFELVYPFSTQMERVSVLSEVKRNQKFPSTFFEEMLTEKEFVQWLLSPDPASRPNTDEIMESSCFKAMYRDFNPPVERMRSRYSSSL